MKVSTVFSPKISQWSGLNWHAQMLIIYVETKETVPASWGLDYLYEFVWGYGNWIMTRVPWIGTGIRHNSSLCCSSHTHTHTHTNTFIHTHTHTHTHTQIHSLYMYMYGHGNTVYMRSNNAWYTHTVHDCGAQMMVQWYTVLAMTWFSCAHWIKA